MKKYLLDMFIKVQNGQIAKKMFVLHAKKAVCKSILDLLWDEGFISGYKESVHKIGTLKIYLKYRKNKPLINKFKIISKPGRRIYYSLKYIWKIDSNKVFMILSTSVGLKTLTECKMLQVGGEPLVEIL